jgi:hypothetical protein
MDTQASSDGAATAPTNETAPIGYTKFYTADAQGAYLWDVEKHTAKTWTVSRELSHGHRWRRVVKSADIGVRYFPTSAEALLAYITEQERELKFLLDRVQSKRTVIGMAQSQFRALESK